MIKLLLIGHLGKDAEVNMHGSDSVINFSVAHTDKYKDGNGTPVTKTTWVSCSWWVERTTIAQYLKKGTQVYVEGVAEAKMWRTHDGENKCGLNCRVYSVQLLGGSRDNTQQGSQPAQQQSQTSNTGYQPGTTDIPQDDNDDLPF